MIYRLEYTGERTPGNWVGPNPFVWENQAAGYIVMKEGHDKSEAENESVKLVETDESDEAALSRYGLKDLDKPKTQPSPTE